MREMMILLPRTVALLRSRRKPSIAVDTESYALYFDNFIHPLRPEYDVEIATVLTAPPVFTATWCSMAA